MRSILLAVLLVLGVPAHAALVDNGSFTTDTASSLDWLDLSVTDSLGVNAALTANSGWRLASNTEIEDLFAVAFDGYYDTYATQHYSFSRQGAYVDQFEDVAIWVSLFGPTRIGASASSYGFYYDEDNIYRRMGVLDDTDSNFVYSAEYTPNFDSSQETGDSATGVFLVRSSVVPIPAAVWLFGSALAGLGWVRRKQTA
jgi:hypothetical protein